MPIVGGQKEDGWEGVGALTFVYPGYGYMGSFCSGTLIAPSWVLTAAHCLSETDGMALYPPLVSFFVGTDSNPSKWGQLPDGKLLQADKFVVHPKYNPNWITNDIALMHLAKPADGVPFYPLNTKPIVEEMFGTELLYVGYGVNNGITNDGGGIKRSAMIKLAGTDEKVYYSEYVDAGVCFGDSGGPGLLEYPEDGTWHVAGINSFVGGEGQTWDPCKDASGHTRVDAFLEWVDFTVNGPQPTCTEDPSLCWCNEACEDGQCKNEVCQTADCKHLYWCLADCSQDPECATGCYVTATDDASAVLQKFLTCMYKKCSMLEGEAWEACVDASCAEQHDKCMPEVTGDMTCGQVHECIVGCEGGTYSCRAACTESGTAEAKDQLETMYDCIKEYCGDEPMGSYKQCVAENCQEEYYGCIPAADCSVAGGDCPEGFACFSVGSGLFDCLATEGVEVGKPCDPDAEFPLYCVDGSACYTQPNQLNVCQPLCLSDDDCLETEQCDVGQVGNAPELGFCVCRDDDGDGWCVTEECADDDAQVNPSLGELCYDGLDNDCDGETDEGCKAEKPEEKKDVGDEQDGADVWQEVSEDAEGGIHVIPAGGSGSGCSASPTTPAGSVGTAFLLAVLVLAGLALRRRQGIQA